MTWTSNQIGMRCFTYRPFSGNALTSLSVASWALAGHPERRLAMIGITGTNGKSTVADLVGRIAAAAGQRPPLCVHRADKAYLGAEGAETNRRHLSAIGAGNLAKALGLYALGVRPGHRVAILAENSPLWVISDFSITGKTKPVWKSPVRAQAPRDSRCSPAGEPFLNFRRRCL